jgi:hypothetical protein
MRLDLDALCDENGFRLSFDPTQCFLVPIIVKCNKIVAMKIQTFFYFSAFACFIIKESI